jgi:hypothetical protein
MTATLEAPGYADAAGGALLISWGVVIVLATT